MNQRYRSCAVLDDGTEAPGKDVDMELHYVPTTHPGARLPHVWVFDAHGREHSTLDLTGHGVFTLMTGIGGEAWVAAAEAEGARRGMKIATRVIGPRRDYEDHTGDWARAREVSDSGCLLIRPDHHVAWRAMQASGAEAQDLAKALRTLLGR